MKLFAVLVGDDGSGSGTSIGSNLSGSAISIIWFAISCGRASGQQAAGHFEERRTYNYTTIVNASNNGRSGTGRLGQRDALGVEGRIAVVV